MKFSRARFLSLESVTHDGRIGVGRGDMSPVPAEHPYQRL